MAKVKKEKGNLQLKTKKPKMKVNYIIRRT